MSQEYPHDDDTQYRQGFRRNGLGTEATLWASFPWMSTGMMGNRYHSGELQR